MKVNQHLTPGIIVRVVVQAVQVVVQASLNMTLFKSWFNLMIVKLKKT